MAPEKKYPNAGTGMTTRNKITIAGLIIVVIIIIWQVIDMMGGESPPADITPVATNQPSPAPKTVPASVTPQAQPILSTTPSQQSAPVQTASAEMQTTDMQKKAEREYVDRINQLQLLKVQREIEETNQAIASAKLATVTAQKGISDILTKPSMQTGVVFTPPPIQSAPPSPSPPVETPVSTVEAALSSYNVVSVSMLHGQWAAVLSSQGKLYNIVVGDVLPDTSVVRSINKYGVILRKDGQVRKLSMTSSM